MLACHIILLCWPAILSYYVGLPWGQCVAVRRLRRLTYGKFAISEICLPAPARRCESASKYGGQVRVRVRRGRFICGYLSGAVAGRVARGRLEFAGF